jgi:cation diffusion facilitator family transporter
MPAHPLRGPILLSILAAILTIGLKTVAYFLTDSVGLLSDALESGINLLAALTAYWSLWYASFPADETHTYGHEKIEFFSSGLEGVLILIAGIGIAYFSIRRLITPTPLESLGIGTILALVASGINFFVAIILLRVGRKQHSIVLEADGKHLMTDVLTSVGVVLGLGLVALTGWEILDPIIALLIGCNILWTGYDLIRRSFDGLMDSALSLEDQQLIRSTIRDHLPPGTTFHALRTRRAGTRQFADWHLLVPGVMSVTDAHHLGEKIERAVQEKCPRLEMTIHIEPIEEQNSWTDNQLAAFEPQDQQ